MQTATRLVNRPAPPPAASTVQVAKVVRPAAAMRLQCDRLRVSRSGDSSEVEARRVARTIVTMPQPAATLRAVVMPTLLNRADNAASLQPARPAPRPLTPPPQTAGRPLPPEVRHYMEPRFKADFTAVRIHTDSRAALLNRQLGARAFTVGNQIFFGAGQYQPDSGTGRELIAHELIHTIQQNAVRQEKRSPPAESEVAVSSPPAVQRLGLDDALNYFAEHANAIPGFRLLTLVLGMNPLTMQPVDRSPANLLRGVVEVMPGGALITQALDNHGIIERVAGWVQQQLQGLGMIGASIRQAVSRFLHSLRWTDIFDLGGVWERARHLVTEPVQRIRSFIGSLIAGVLRFIREAVLQPLAGFAQRIPGWDLLCAVLGRNPISGEPVARTADSLIGGFMRLIGREDIWRNIQRANAIARAFAWFNGAVAGVRAFVAALPQLFLNTLQSLTIRDLLTIPQTFARTARVFAGFVGNLMSWAGQQVWRLLEIIFDVVAPGVMPYLRRAAAAFRTIIANPVGFIGNLVRAGILGFRQFASNILTHLRAALIGWLTGAMAGANIYIPQALTLQEIIKFVLSVLGLTWQNIRAKLVRAVGETAVAAMERGLAIVVTLVREGPAAAWQQIRESLANLREMVMEQIMTFVRNNIVVAAVTRLVSMLNPAGAFIQAIIAIYNTIMFFVERLRQIAQVAAAVIDSIAAIASGAIAAAASRVEQTMAGLLTLVISFLARLVGLGRVSTVITTIINRIRATIDRALDRVVAWILRLGRRFLTAARGATGCVLQWWRQRQSFRGADGRTHALYFSGEGRAARLTMASEPMPVEAFLAGIEARSEYRTPTKRALIAQVRQQVAAMQTAQSLPEAQAEQAQTRIAAAFTAMTPLLMQLLEGPAFATESQPLPMRYPKRRWSAYPVIYIGPRSAGRVRQEDLRNNRKAEIRNTLSPAERAEWANQGEPIVALRPTATTTLPTGDTVGIQGEYRVETGKKLRLVPGSTQGGGLINRTFQPFGYRARSEGMDGDHVVEMQIGGPNALPNLWPLAAGENRSSGSTIASMSFTRPDGSQITMDALKTRARNGIEVWLVITSTL